MDTGGLRKADSDAASVSEIFTGEVVYRAPLFQRYYVWDSRQLDALWRDLDTVIEESSSSRFLGAIVLKAFQYRTSSKPAGYWIIDGQQRLTTFYLILLACSYLANKLGHQGIAHDYIRGYILQQQSQVRNETKLIPTLPDLCQFKEVLSYVDEYSPISPGAGHGRAEGPLLDSFIRNLHEIETRITVGGEPSVDLLENFVNTILEKVEFVQIYLAEHHDANEVFNRLNDSGQPLETIDLIRNEVFSLLKSDVKQAQAIYDSHWVDFEKSFDLGDSKELMRRSSKIRNGYFFPFALIKNSSTKSSQVFANLSQEWRGRITGRPAQESARYIIHDLNQYVSPYLAYSAGIRPEGISDKLWQTVSRFNRMAAPSTLLPYTLRVLKGVLEGSVEESEAISCLDLVESFLVRRALVGLEPTGLHAVFKNIWSKAGVDPQGLRAHLQTSTIDFPDDEQFEIGVKFSDLYHRRLCKYILEEYERSFTRGDILESFPPITVDHVMPQSRQGAWVSSVSEDDHKKYVHSWANLVPLSGKANSEKGINSWPRIKEELQNETIFSSTKNLISTNENWGVEQIIARAQHLYDWAVIRWSK